MIFYFHIQSNHSKYSTLLISTAKLSELYILTNSDIKARNGHFRNSSRKHTYIIFDPLKPPLYIVKLGFIGVYIVFLISAQNIDCGYSLEPPRRGGSNEYPQSMFLSRNKKTNVYPVNPTF